jgi:hypothetical protein
MKLCNDLVSNERSVSRSFLKKASEYEKPSMMKSLEIPLWWAPENDNLITTQTPEYTEGKYNVKINQ